MRNFGVLNQVVAVPMPLRDDPEITLGALRWVIDQALRPGEIVHIVHVVKCMVQKLEVYHGGHTDQLPCKTSVCSQDCDSNTGAPAAAKRIASLLCQVLHLRLQEFLGLPIHLKSLAACIMRTRM